MCGWFDNDDGLMIVRRPDGLGLVYRLLYTDSRHYLLPTDDYTGKMSQESKRLNLMAQQFTRQVEEEF